MKHQSVRSSFDSSEQQSSFSSRLPRSSRHSRNTWSGASSATVNASRVNSRGRSRHCTGQNSQFCKCLYDSSSISTIKRRDSNILDQNHEDTTRKKPNELVLMGLRRQPNGKRQQRRRRRLLPDSTLLNDAVDSPPLQSATTKSQMHEPEDTIYLWYPSATTTTGSSRVSMTTTNGHYHHYTSSGKPPRVSSSYTISPTPSLGREIKNEQEEPVSLTVVVTLCMLTVVLTLVLCAALAEQRSTRTCWLWARRQGEVANDRRNIPADDVSWMDGPATTNSTVATVNELAHDEEIHGDEEDDEPENENRNESEEHIERNEEGEVFRAVVVDMGVRIIDAVISEDLEVPSSASPTAEARDSSAPQDQQQLNESRLRPPLPRGSYRYCQKWRLWGERASS